MQARDCSALDFLTGRADLYETVWSYLDAAGITPAWPRRTHPPSERAVQEKALNDTFTYVRNLLEMTIPLAGNRHVKILSLGWAHLNDLERTVALDALRLLLEAELHPHPEARLELEVDELAPPLQTLFQELARSSGRFSYRVVPELALPANPFSETGEF